MGQGAANLTDAQIISEFSVMNSYVIRHSDKELLLNQ
jgi:hypothetical protein